ncbi:MAG TPA: OmpA family protein [Cytophagaceae bacterium]
MILKRLTPAFICLLSLSLVTSCVTRKKYDDLNTQKSRLELEKAECDDQLKVITAENQKLKDELADYKERHKVLVADTAQTGTVLRRTQRNYEALNETYEQLLRNHNRLQSHSASEIDKINKDLARREQDLMESEKKVKTLQANLEEREIRVKELENILEQKEKAVNDLKAIVSNALYNFKEKDLTVEVRNGKVYVSLADQLLFKSGSTEVDPKGVDALKKLANALKEQYDLRIMVEGHTDDVPVAKGTVGVKDNWDLSVLRATSILRILANEGLDPRNIIPAGRGEFSPKVEGKTSEARQKNRRTEIILTPKLDELFKILENN